MSAGAPINISSVLDLTGPYRDLAAFRTAAAQPVTIGAGTFSTPGAGATFGATGGIPYPASSVIASYQAIGPRPTGIGPALLGQGANSSTQFNQAIQQLTQAIASISRSGTASPTFATWNPGTQSLRSLAFDPTSGQFINPDNGTGIEGFGWPGAGAGIGGRGGSGTRGTGAGRGGWGTRGLARYLSAGFALNEATRITEGYRQYNVQSILADNDPLALYEAETTRASTLKNIPIVGRLGALIQDPLGYGEAENQAVLRNSNLSTQFSQNNLDRSNRTESAREQSRIANLTGSNRPLAQFQEDLRSRNAEITAERLRSGNESDALSRSERSVAIASNQTSLFNKFGAFSERFQDAVEGFIGGDPLDSHPFSDYENRVDKDRQNALDRAERNNSDRGRQADLRASTDRSSALALAAGRRADFDFAQDINIRRNNLGESAARSTTGQFVDLATIQENRRNRDATDVAEVRRGPGGDRAADTLARLREAEGDKEDAEYRRGVGSQSFQLGNAGQIAIRRASGDSFGAQISQLYGGFREKIDNETRPDLRGPILQNFIQGIQATAIGQSRQYESIDSSTSSINASINRQPLLAQHIALEQERKVALRNTESLPNLGNFGFGLDFNFRDQAQGSLNRNFDARRRQGDQEFGDQTRLITRRYDDTIGRLAIENDRTSTWNGAIIDPFARRSQERAFDILADVRNQSEDLAKSGRGSDVLYGKIRTIAEGKFDLERNEILEGIQGSNIDPTLTPTSGIGTFNLGAAIGTLGEDKKRIAAEQAGGVGAAVAGTPTADDIAKGAQTIVDAIKAITGISDILAALNKLQGQ